MRLVISSWWFPVCVATYLLRAARRGGHDVRTVGPTNGDRIPWEEELAFPGFGIKPDANSPAAAEAFAGWADLWIDVDGGWFLPAELPARRRVGVVTDPHCGKTMPDYSGERMRPFVDRVYMMQSPYCKPDDGWLPYGFDPVWHRPMASACDYDVTNLGATYPDRVAITAALRAKGLRVLGPERATIGPAYARQLCRAPVAVVWPLDDDLPCRVFEAAACGRFVVTRDVPDLRRIDPPPQWAYRCDHKWEVLERAAELSKPSPTKPAASSWFLNAHTWDARLAQLIEGRDAS